MISQCDNNVRLKEGNVSRMNGRTFPFCLQYNQLETMNKL